MICYRVENYAQQGPYGCRMSPYLSDLMWDLGLNPNNHPSPDAEGLDLYSFPSGDYHCAFATMMQFHRWFGIPELLIAMDKSGFKLVVRNALYYERGNWQMIFEMESSKLLSRHSLLEFI